MKIVLNDWQDLRDQVAMLSPALLVEWNAGLQTYLQDRPVKVAQTTVVTGGTDAFAAQIVKSAPIVKSAEDQWAKAHFGHDVHPEGYQGLPADIAQPEMPDLTGVHAAVRGGPEPDAVDDPAQLDLDGVAHTTDWHSDPPKINADGRWKARRKRDADAYAAWLLEQAREAAAAAIAADAEPVATETHTLPQDGPTAEPDPTAADPTLDVDLDAVLAQALEIAGDQPDGHIELLAACKAFMTAHSHGAFNDLKAAVAPDGSPGGKSLQNFSPAERRLMQAVLAVYPKPE